MKRIRILLLCMTFALCTLFIAGCGNDDSSGSGTSANNGQSASAGNNGTSGNENTSRNNDSDRSSLDKDNGGILDDVGDELKTIADDAESKLNDMVD